MAKVSADEIWFHGDSHGDILNKLNKMLDEFPLNTQVITVQELKSESSLATKDTFMYSKKYLIVVRL